MSQLELRVVLEHHSHARLREAATARLELGLLVDDPLIVLVHRLQGVTPWNHAAYCWHTALERDATRDLLSSAWPAGRGLVLQYVCTSACDPSVRINRRFKLDWGFSSALHSAVRRQASIPFDGVESVLAIARLGLGSVDGEVLAARAVVRTTVAG